MSSHTTSTTFRDDQDIEIDFVYQRAEPDVGIMLGYAEIESVKDAISNEELTITDEEHDRLVNVCMEHLEQTWDDLADSSDYDD